MRFNVLGPIGVDHDGRRIAIGGPQQRRLLALLLIDRRSTVPVDRMVDVLWPDGDAPHGASRSVLTYVSRLRAALGVPIVMNGYGYRIDRAGTTCDADEFVALCDEAARALPDRAVDLYEHALSLWHGRAFGEFADEWWALAESARLGELATAAREAHAEALIVLGHHTRALPALERLVVDHPLRERPVAALMQALAASGRRTDALRAFHAFRSRLAETSGLPPSPALVDLERSIVASDDLAPTGTPLRGYVIRRVIGEGAHGRVYEATQPGTDRPVAIKAIRPDLADSTEFIRRFEAEARFVARIEHPHVVPLYDYWREPGGAYLVFRLLRGGSAKESIVTGGAWSLSRVDRFVEEVGGALLAAHARGVAHRDVRAANVMLDELGGAYLTDFGIADLARPEDPSELAADVRSFSRLTWELLTGDAAGGPRAGRGALRDDLAHDRAHVADLPEGLAAVLERGMRPDDGFPSISEFLLAWRAAMGAPAARSPMTRDLGWLDSARRAAARALLDSASAGVNPYRGLEPFDDADGDTFFGRGEDVARLAELAEGRPFVTVVGASGSGKSSLVRAGLVPRLRHAGHVTVTMVPGTDPVHRLAAALTEVSASTIDDLDACTRIAAIADRIGHAVVVVVDQFEEVWTAAAPDVRLEFIDVLRSIVDGGRAKVVTTVRADLLDRPLQDPTIGHLVGAGTFVVGPLSPAQLEEAIVLPAQRVGVRVDEGLVAELVADAAARPGSLPMLQFTMTQLYERRRDGLIERSALDEIGGLGGAIGARAERTLHEAGDLAIQPTRELFLRLVTPGLGGAPDLRRRARTSDLPPIARDVADRYVAARLLVVDRDERTREPTIEIAHEVLLERWPRLAGWIDADRQWLSALDALGSAAVQWDAAGRDDDELLLRGTRLEAAIEALEVDGRVVTDLERAFVTASRDLRDRDLRSARRSASRLRRLLVATAAALVIATVAGAVAVVQRREAVRSAAAADASAADALAAGRVARIEALVGRSESLRVTQRDVAALVAAEAYRLDDNPRTRSALFATFTAAPALLATHRLDPEPGATGSSGRLSGIVMPDGASAFVLDHAGRVRPLDLATGDRGPAWPATSPAVPRGEAMLRASPDGQALAQISWVEQEGRAVSVVAIADAARGRWRFEPVVLDGPHLSADFSHDGSTLFLTLAPDSTLVGLDTSTGAIRAVLPNEGEVAPGGGGLTVVDGGRVLVSQDDGEVLMVDGTSFDELGRLAIPAGTSFSLRTAGDGTAAIGTGVSGLVRIEIDPLEQVWARIDDADTCPNIAVFDDADAILCGDVNGRLAVRDEATGTVAQQLDPQNGDVGTLWPAAGQRELVTFGNNEPVVTRWSLNGAGAITRVLEAGWFGDLLSPDGSRLLMFPATGRGLPDLEQLLSGRIIDVGTAEPIASTEGYAVGNWITDDRLSVGVPIGETLGTGVFSVAEGGLVGPLGEPLPGLPDYFEPTPGKTASAARFFDGSTSRMTVYSAPAVPGATVERSGYWVPSSSRDGSWLVIGGANGIELIDARTGDVLRTRRTTTRQAAWVTAADQLFVTSAGGELVQHDLQTLAPIRTFGGSRGNIENVFSTADGSVIVVKGADRFVTLYDTATGIAIGTPMVVPDSDVNLTPALALDGSLLVYGGGPTTGAKVWDLRPQRWLEAVCEVAGRNLTRDEWATHIGDLVPYRATCPQFPLDA